MISLRCCSHSLTQGIEGYTEEGVPTEAGLSRVTGLTVSSLRACQSTVLSALDHDTAAISAVHSLHIYLVRLGLSTQRWQVWVWVWMCRNFERN